MANTVKDQVQLYRVELHLLTYMWNEGFEKAESPWLQLYTDNRAWVEALPGEYRIPQTDGFDQELRVIVDRLDPDGKLPTQEELESKDADESLSRFAMLTFGLSSQELDRIVAIRLSEWDGV